MDEADDSVSTGILPALCVELRSFYAEETPPLGS
jgi:hypothetical protein